jgi:hypothetical protein
MGSRHLDISTFRAGQHGGAFEVKFADTFRPDRAQLCLIFSTDVLIFFFSEYNKMDEKEAT